jgi:uncharacterized membrane protein
MSTTPSKLVLSPREAAIVYFIAVILIYLAKWNPPSTAPAIVNTALWIVGLVAIVAQYELQFVQQPTIPQAQAALFSSLALILGIISGQISALAGSFWWSGLVVAVIGGFLAAYAQIGGVIPPVPGATPSSAPTA